MGLIHLKFLIVLKKFGYDCFDGCDRLNSLDIKNNIKICEGGPFECGKPGFTLNVYFTQDNIPAGFDGTWDRNVEIINYGVNF